MFQRRGGRGTDVDVAMCSDTRWSKRLRDLAIDFWFVGQGKHLTGDPDGDEEVVLVLACKSWPVVFLWTALEGDLWRVT